jgi:hypothetical protein
MKCPYCKEETSLRSVDTVPKGNSLSVPVLLCDKCETIIGVSPTYFAQFLGIALDRILSIETKH